MAVTPPRGSDSPSEGVADAGAKAARAPIASARVYASLQSVAEVRRDHFGEKLVAEHGVPEAENYLDALVDVALHPIGAAEENFGLASVGEDEDAAVLEKTPDDTAHANSAAQPANTGAQRARAADDQLDMHAGLRRTIERLNDFFVEQ